MNSLVKVFSNFREFYSEINGATLTGAIDVIIVEQPDGSYLCSPFHVRFGKLGVLRSREKIVDIEINGEPVDIHMKLGESGEAFFVEECQENDLDELPENMATSPLPTDDFSKFMDDKIYVNAENTNSIEVVKPRRNSIDFSTEVENLDKRFENQFSEYSNRRHTDNTLERRDLTAAKKEYTTQKIRQEWAEHEEQIKQSDISIKNDISELDSNTNSNNSNNNNLGKICQINEANNKDDSLSLNSDKLNRDESKSKKKRRKKSMIKKKNAQRKSSSSSSVGSTVSDVNDVENESSKTLTADSSTSESVNLTEMIASEKCIEENDKHEQIADDLTGTPPTPPSRIRDLDIHFFSDTELASGKSPQTSRPPTPIQSDSEFEISQRDHGVGNNKDSAASWKWGELPTQAENPNDLNTPDGKQAQRNSMLSNMFSFMKQSKKMRKGSSEGIYLSDLNAGELDAKTAALYFPPNKNHYGEEKNINENDDDVESGNGTSLLHTPSSVGSPKSLDSDFEEGKITDNKYLDFVAMSLCGGLDQQGGPNDEQFNQHLVKYNEVCQNPSIFASPSLVVRLNGKYYSWSAACPIVMTIITFQKPLTNEAIEQLMSSSKPTDSTETERKRGYSWWYWRRSDNKQESKLNKSFEQKSDDPNVSQDSNRYEQDLNINKPSNSGDIDNYKETIGDMAITKDGNKPNEVYKKSLRLSSDQIASLNLKNGMNEISFSVTTAYQGTSRCKCYLFKWKHSDKVVISDIDGTITKSDVLGHILPMVGKDWAQIGVAQLFSKIEENGYKLLYLSARAIGQSRVTREYLRSIRQGDVKLPDGPLLLNPTSLISAFHREVIERKPEQFKIACLTDIQTLFPGKNPFYAGYGNKINDVWAYRAVGIPIMRIFTINPKGELKHELTQTFQSTYTGQSLVVNETFPPLRRRSNSSSTDDEGASLSDDSIISDELMFDVEQ